MAEVHRIGKWTALAALEAAMETIKDEDTLMIVSIDREESSMKFWAANCTNMQANWMADNVKWELMGGEI